MAERTQRSNILLAFISLTAVIAVVSLIGFFTLGKGPEIIQGQAEADEYRVSGKVPARILELRVKEGNKVKHIRATDIYTPFLVGADAGFLIKNS